MRYKKHGAENHGSSRPIPQSYQEAVSWAIVLSVTWIKLSSIPYYRLFIDYLHQQGLLIGKDELPIKNTDYLRMDIRELVHPHPQGT